MSDEARFIVEYDVREACSRAACAERIRERDEARAACAINEKRANGWRAEYVTARAEVASLTRERDEAQELANGLNDGCVEYEKTIARLQGALEGAWAMQRRVAELIRLFANEPSGDVIDALDQWLDAYENPSDIASIEYERALRPPEVDPTSTPAKKESPGAPIGETRPHTAVCFKCWCECGQAPPDTGARPGLRPARDVAHQLLCYLAMGIRCAHYGDPCDQTCDKFTAAIEADRRSR